MRSVTLVWPAVDLDVLAVSQTFALNVPITWNVAPNSALMYEGVQHANNIFTGTSTSYINMPYTTHRSIAITSTGGTNLTGVTFTITGYIFNPNDLGSVVSPDPTLVTETIAGPGIGATVRSPAFWTSVVSVTATAGTIPANSQVSLGYGTAGRTGFFLLDTWNKSSIITIGYDYIYPATTGTFSIIPVYTSQNIWTFPKGVPTFSINPQTVPELDIANPNVVLGTRTGAPPVTTLPITTAMTISISNLAMTSIATFVNQDLGFTQTIVQQGGKF